MKLNRIRVAWTFATLTFLTGAVVTLLDTEMVQSAGGEAPGATAPADAAAPPTSPTSDAQASATAPAATAATAEKEVITTSSANSCLSDPVVIDELKKKRADLDQKQKELQTKETELKARETAINYELKKLQDLRADISKTDEDHRKVSEEKVAKVVETLQTMSPKASAQMLTGLDDVLAVEAISRMDTAKLAKIMNVIDSKRATKLTELLAGVVRARNSSTSNDVAETTNSRQIASISAQSDGGKKGGEKYDNNNKPESIISGGPEQPTNPEQKNSGE
jgi:flagellar motility protein MotE (MotC chaperone)